MPRGRADIANTALRIFLQEMGAAYDQERGLEPYNGSKHFKDVRAFFGERCCYCGDDLQTGRVAQDHLIPMNETSLGLHSWGNVVPACQDCNAKKQGKEWHAYLVTRAKEDAAERYERVTQFVTHYKYAPDPNDLRATAEEPLRGSRLDLDDTHRDEDQARAREALARTQQAAIFQRGPPRS